MVLKYYKKTIFSTFALCTFSEKGIEIYFVQYLRLILVKTAYNSYIAHLSYRPCVPLYEQPHENADKNLTIYNVLFYNLLHINIY